MVRPASRAFLGEAIAAGVGNQGLSVPIRGPGGQFAVFTLSTRERDDLWATFTREKLSDLLLMAHFINQKARDFEDPQELSSARQLSPRERDTLSLLAAGQSRSQAAEKLGISEHTLRAYIEAGRLKLGAVNTTHAVALALTQGLIML